MAFDASQTGPIRLDEETIASMRLALRAYVDRADESAPLRSALAVMTTEARRKAMLPEQLLIVLKELWTSLAEVREIADVSEQIRMQQRVVTMCIREYFDA
jgi:hypothetical protein